MGSLLPGEMAKADNGYRGERQHIRLPRDYVSTADRVAKKRARARHGVFRYDKEWH